MRKDLQPIVLASAGVAGGSLLILQFFTTADPLGRCFTFWRQLRKQEKKLTCSDNVNKGITDYSKLHREADTDTRLSEYKDLVNSYYDLATVFYEWGWGSAFHFAYRYAFESFGEAIRRHEYTLAAQLNECYGPDKKVLDVGCGIGGPARSISKFLQCAVTGITINPYQVQRANELNEKDKPLSNVHAVQGDFMELPFEPESFDGAYAIEATCHAPDRVKCYQEVYKALKPGAVFCCYEWCLTDKYDKSNPEHQRMMEDIKEGNGLPDVNFTHECWDAMKQAGFELIYESDLALIESSSTWMTPLMPSWNVFSQRFQFNSVGAVIANVSIFMLEFVRLAPAGTVKTQKILQAGGFALRDAGNAGIFTTMYLMVGRKPQS